MSRTLELFEHQRVHVSRAAAGLRPAEFDALVQFNDAHGGRYFEIGHRCIRAKNYVGYVEVGDLSIEILPKADGDQRGDAQPWRDGLLDMLRVALGLRLRRLPEASQRTARSRLLELIAQAFLDEVEPLLHGGLAKGYRTTQANGSIFRGRLKLSEHLRDNAARADRFFVEYQTFDRDILLNRILAEALRVLAQAALSPGVACLVASARGRFPELGSVPVTVADLERVRLNRATNHYAAALTYAQMILRSQGPQLRTGAQRVFALLFDMNALWEQYVAVLLRSVAPKHLQVHAQERHLFWTPSGHRARRVFPDVVVRAAGAPGRGATRLVIDTKWKVPSSGVPSDDDLKQMFVYNELLEGGRAMLLYPQTAKSKAVGGPFVGKRHTCEQRHLGLFEDGRWSGPAIKRQLRELLAGIAIVMPPEADA